MLGVWLNIGYNIVTRKAVSYTHLQVPSKEYSDVIRNALFSPEYMEQKMLENKDKIAMSAFKKSMTKVNELKNIFTVSNKMIGVISVSYTHLDVYKRQGYNYVNRFIVGIMLFKVRTMLCLGPLVWW